MTALLVFAPIYLFGVYAFCKHAWDSAVRVDQYGDPATAKIIPFPRKGEALPFHHTRLNVQGSKLVVPAVNPSRGGN